MERRVVPLAERLRRLGRKRLHERVVTVRQSHDQVVGLAFDPVDDHERLAEVGLGVARRVHERHEHLLPAQPLLAHVVFDDRVAAPERVLRP